MNPNLGSPEGVIRHARASGVILKVDGDRLRYKSTAALEKSLAGLLEIWKVPIKARLVDTTLEDLASALSGEDAWELRLERAAIQEFDGNLSRGEAEWRAGTYQERTG